MRQAVRPRLQLAVGQPLLARDNRHLATAEVRLLAEEGGDGTAHARPALAPLAEELVPLRLAQGERPEFGEAAPLAAGHRYEQALQVIEQAACRRPLQAPGVVAQAERQPLALEGEEGERIVRGVGPELDVNA